MVRLQTPAEADVTVVIPALDREGHVGRAVASALDQQPRPRRVVVVDDGSTDGTRAEAARAGADVMSSGPRGGSGPARNVGIRASRTEWVAFLDSDDTWADGHLAGLLEAAQGLVLVTAPARGSGGRWKGNATGRRTILTHRRLLDPENPVVTSGTMVRRSALTAVGGFRSIPRAQDLDLWLRVLETGPGAALPAATVRYLEHAGQASADRSLMRRHFVDVVASYAGSPWMTRGLAERAAARWYWDELRASRSLAAARTPAWWFLRHPAALATVARLLQHRRRERALSL